MAKQNQISDKLAKRLNTERVAWLTTISPDGEPQPTPVWFIWENGSFLIYSQPGAKKMRNLKNNPHIAINLNCDEWGGEVAIFRGKAILDTSAPPAHQNQAYLDKYLEGIQSLQQTPEAMGAEYSVAIRLAPAIIKEWD